MSAKRLRRKGHTQIRLLLKKQSDHSRSCLLFRQAVCLFQPWWPTFYLQSGLKVIKLEYSLKLKIKHNDLLLVDACPEATNHFALFWVWEWTQVLLPWGQKEKGVLNFGTFTVITWARIWQKVPYGCDYQILANVKTFQILPLKSISWKFTAIIFNSDDYMKVRSDLSKRVGNVTSKMSFIQIWCQSAGLRLFVGYFWLSINIWEKTIYPHALSVL